jgi:Fe-S cluster assembly protein SufD
VFVDGRFAPEFSEPGTPEGVRLATLSRSIVDHSETVRTHLCAQNGPASLPFATLNTAFFLDGAMVKVEPKTQVERPLHVLFVTTPGGGPRATASRLLIVAGAGSRVRLVEEHAGVGDGEGFACAVTEIAVLEDARVEHVRLQNEGPGAVHIGTVSARVGRHGRYVSRAISLGARLARIEIDVTLEGEGAECELDGLYVASDRQHVDHHTRIDHVSPHTTSRELYKGVLGGKATGVFNGRVVVREGASKTEAVQANHNLLLSDHALVNTNPELEILTDDVVARHGATIGQLDPEQMFYLRSRGIATPEARTILIDGFAGEIIQRVRMTPLVERLAAILARRF